MARPKRMDYWKDRPVMYRCYDKTGRLVYVGATKNMPRRASEHRAFSWWMQIVTKTRMQVFPTIEAARAAELIAIQEEQPIANTIGTGRAAGDRSFPLWTKADRKMAKAWMRGAKA